MTCRIQSVSHGNERNWLASNILVQPSQFHHQRTKQLLNFLSEFLNRAWLNPLGNTDLVRGVVWTRLCEGICDGLLYLFCVEWRGSFQGKKRKMWRRWRYSKKGEASEVGTWSAPNELKLSSSKFRIEKTAKGGKQLQAYTKWRMMSLAKNSFCKRSKE